jgi:membrane-bound lytic murein transglycosylase D
MSRSYYALVLAAALSAFSAHAAGRAHPAEAVPAVTGVAGDDAADASILGSAGSQAQNMVLSPETDACLQRSWRHLSDGRLAYFEGNLEVARREFDLAVQILLDAPDSLPDRRRIERRLEDVSELIYRFDTEKMGAGETLDSVTFDKAPIDEISHMTFEVDPRLAPQVTHEVQQTQSGIPLEMTDPVLSYIHYFSTDRGRAVLKTGLQRAGRYKPMIQRVLAEEGVPQELIYLAQAESGFLARAVSNKQAVGMWQFIAGTGARYDLVRTTNFDERLDPEKATRAAARHLKDLYGRYGDWYLALAAYNCGAGNVDRAVERTGYADYWELLKRNALPRETANYVPIIVAMTIIAKNPKDYGLENYEEDSPADWDSIQLEAATNLELIADAAEQPVSVIRDLNPELLRNVAPAGLSIHVPKGAAESTQAELAAVPAAKRDAWRLHHVVLGDTLASLAALYHTSVQGIATANRGLESLEAGARLLIPAAYHEVTNHPARYVRKSGHAPGHALSGAAGSRSARVATANAAVNGSLHAKAASGPASLR